MELALMVSKEYDAAEWKFFLCQFWLLELCLGGNLDDLTSFDQLAYLASFSFKYLARSSSKLSFGFLPLWLLWSLPPFILGHSDFSISRRSWSELFWPVGATGLTYSVPVWPVGPTSLTYFSKTVEVTSCCSDHEVFDYSPMPFEKLPSSLSSQILLLSNSWTMPLSSLREL